MSNPFQWIVDSAVDVTINKRAVVAQTVARDQTVRGTSRGGQVWRFTVTPSPGVLWTDARPYVEQLDKADRVFSSYINFSKSSYNYLFGYQGNATVQPTSISYTQGSTVVALSGGTCTSGYKFRAGDLVQFTGSDRVYSFAADVLYTDTVAILNRPVLEASGSSVPIIGPACNFKIICTQFPDYKIDPTDRCVKWSGPFILFEELV
jgi:hypothetical protein